MKEFKKAILPPLKALEINYVKWTGNNFEEVHDFVENFKVYKQDCHDIYICVTGEGVPKLYIEGIGEVRVGDYIVSGNTRRNYGYNKLYVSSYKDLPYEVESDELLKEREQIVYKGKDYWVNPIQQFLPFFNTDYNWFIQ